MNIKTLTLTVLLLFSPFFLFSCHGDDDDTPPAGAAPVTSLAGNATDRAIDHTYDLNAITGIASAEIEVDPTTGTEIAITSFQVRLTQNATVGEVNNMLALLNGEVVSMFQGAPFLLIHIPNPGGLAEYNVIISDLSSESFVEYVSPGHFPAARDLPPNHTYGDGNTHKLYQHLAVRAHAAWHVKYLADISFQPPHLIIADIFGDGNPNADFNVASYGSSIFKTGNPNNHGYGVLGVILANFGGNSTSRGLLTGIYPSSLDVTGIDGAGGPSNLKHTFNNIEDLIIHSVKSHLGSPVIVNTSIAFPCKTAVEASWYCVDNWARAEGYDWLQKVRSNGLENDFIHVTAAGNISSAATTNTQAMYDSPFAAAHLINNFILPGGTNTPVAPLRNTLVVENVVQSANPPYQPICLDAGSKFAGDISAVAFDVELLASNSDPAGVFNDSGTSFSAPQVAGVAAYLWSLDPALTASDVLDKVALTTSNPVSGAVPVCANHLSAPVLDAYNAVLSADYDLSQPALAPVRSELMDVADSTGAPGRNGQFDELDIQLLESKYNQQAGALDYSRYDLNGDAYTGGTGTQRFDLDLDLAFATVTQTILGSSVSFDESQVTDSDILCYYAYSGIFTGDTQVRDNLIGTMCGVQNCVYYKVLSSVPEWSYIRSCLDPEPTKITYGYTDSSWRPGGFIRLELCDDSSYDLYNYPSCPTGSHETDIVFGYSYNSVYDEEAVGLNIVYLNGVRINTTYACDYTGKLYDDTGVRVLIGDYGDLTACHNVLKGYIPGDPSVFDYPGDCHSWWDHDGEVCTITIPHSF